MNTKTLHILTSSTDQTVDSLAREGVLVSGELAVDLHSFPPLVYEASTASACLDVTDRYLPPVDYWTVARAWLVEFTRETRLEEILSIDGFAFWWVTNALKFVPALSDLGNVFAWIDVLLGVRRESPPQSVVVYGEQQCVLHLIRQVFRGLNVGVRKPHTPASKVEKPRLVSGLRVIRVLLGIAYLICGIFRRIDVCFLSSTSLLRTQTVDKQQRLRDVYLDDVAEKVQARGVRTAWVESYSSNASWSALLTRRFFFPTDLLTVLTQPRLMLPWVAPHVLRKWQTRWSELEPSLAAHMHYQGCDLSFLILPLVRAEMQYEAPRMDCLVTLWRWILSHWRPRLLYINCYYGRMLLPAIIAAKTMGILTVEQQHGVISKNHVAYLVPQDLGSDVRPPLCDKMVVWGDQALRLLVASGHYRLDQLTVCGFPRLDAIYRALPPRNQTLSRLGIPTGARTVLYTSNPIVRDLYGPILDSLVDNNEPTVYWIVKLHPREKTRTLWEEAIRQRQLDRVRVVEGEEDFYALLLACDLHVSFVSTTMIEAAALAIPNLGLDIPHVPDPVGYADAGAYYPVAPDQLGKVTAAILHNSVQREALLQQQQVFAADWCRHDGHAVDCIVTLIAHCLGFSGADRVHAG